MRAVYAIIGIGPALILLAIASCSTEGDALFRVPREDVSPDVVETRPETGRPDTRVIQCGNDGGCVVTNGEQCCAYLLSYYCAEAGTCEGGPIPCDQPAHCEAGQRCCAMPAAFLIQSQCSSASCTQYELCATDDDCTPPQTCKNRGGVYKVCGL